MRPNKNWNLRNTVRNTIVKKDFQEKTNTETLLMVHAMGENNKQARLEVS